MVKTTLGSGSGGEQNEICPTWTELGLLRLIWMNRCADEAGFHAAPHESALITIV